MLLEDLGSLILRVALGGFFLMGAWQSAKDHAARDFTVQETAFVFRWRPELFALAGVLMLAGGGLSVLLGIFPRLGGLIMAVFLVPAAMIHFAKLPQAAALEHEIEPALPGPADTGPRAALAALASSASMGHFTAGLKTLCLIGPALYLALAGATAPMLIGFDADWQLQGLLSRL